MRAVLSALPAINATLTAAGLPAIVPSTEEIKTSPTRPAPGADTDDEVEK
jgi:hypothetical protein